MSMQKCIFKFTVITLHLEQQSNVKNSVKNCKLYYSYSTVLCTFLKCVQYLQCSGSHSLCNSSQVQKSVLPICCIYQTISSKGQIISKANFIVFIKRNYFVISALASIKRSDQNNKGTFYH
jgi:hypothetical protein